MWGMPHTPIYNKKNMSEKYPVGKQIRLTSLSSCAG
jgi:hypothetical protein